MMTKRGSVHNGQSNSAAINIDNDMRKPNKTILDYIKELEKKRASDRVDALSSIVRILNGGKESDELEKLAATFLYHILGLIKRGSAKEKELASHVLGLMAMTLSDTDHAQEIYKDTVSVLTEVLTTTKKVVDPWVFINLLYSLAMVTFFCASNTEETEAAMQIIWKFILPESNVDVTTKNRIPVIIPAAISAWSFLVTSVNGWELSNQWKGAISLFMNMLESDDDNDDDVCVPAAEALAVIFNNESINKFLKAKPELSYSEMKKQIKHSILSQLENISKAKSGIISQKQTSSVPDWNVLKYFKEGISPQISESINENNELTLSSWSSMTQFKFMKNFIGEEEFCKHILENEYFHHLFKFTPYYEKDDAPYLYESTMEKIEHTAYVPEELDPELLTSKQKKQDRQLRQSIIDKSKTRMLNKRRTFAEERKGKMYQVESEL